ncbi:MAG: putative membrane-bound dehydrogenase-like protein [Pirellulaceae bacterium]|jgi:putative membrane-bound dehydrogenase-like protein
MHSCFETPLRAAKHLCGICFLTILAVAAVDAQDAKEATRPAALSPQRSLSEIVLPAGFEIELVASEPNVIDPVAIRFDEYGRLWVVEMRDYPLGPAEGKPGLSTIRLLRDKDGDGVYETSTVFADQLLFPTGLQPWRGGVIVTLSGKIVFMKDEDGDDRADIRETWYEGFAEQNSQLRANHPILGIDGYVYVANGLRGGIVANVRDPAEPPLEIRGYDFRFDPVTGRAETVTGMGQFGLTFNDYGERFVCSNRNPAKHIVLENEYLSRNPKVAISQTSNDVAVAGEASRVYPLVKAWTTSNLHSGQFTAACGVTFYRDTPLRDLQNSVFTCEPTGSLVHCERVGRQGASFASRPFAESKEFLASRDSWFRPVNLDVGPHGDLYVVDMYRAVIEHPQWVPAELQDRLDQRFGDDRGRIYRVTRKAEKSDGEGKPDRQDRNRVGIAQYSPTQLVETLSHSNAWYRDTAARLLLEGRDKLPLEALRQLVGNGKTPQSRAAALCLLKSTGNLETPDLIVGLKDADTEVVAMALRTGDELIRSSKELRKRALELSANGNTQLRFRALLALAPVTSEDEANLVGLVLKSESDPWVVQAALVAAGSHAVPVLKIALSDPQATHDSSLIESLAELAIATGSKPMDLLRLSRTASPTDMMSLLLGTLKKTKSASEVVANVARESDVFHKQFQSVVDLAADRSAQHSERIRAISVLGYSGSLEVLGKLAASNESTEIRSAAVQALTRAPDEKLWRPLLNSVRSYSPNLRRTVLDGMIGNPRLLAMLLDAVEAEQIPATMFEPHQVRRLNSHSNVELRKRAMRLLASVVPADRTLVLQKYQAALMLDSDPIAGREVFKARCSNCHKIADVGFLVGPDISDSRTRTPAQLLTDILQPSRAVDAAFMGYTVITTEGKTFNGVLETENSSSVTIKQLGGKKVVLNRDQIDELRSDGISFMPNGLEKDISRQQMADLISFIKNWRYLDGQIPLREPVVSRPK